MPEIDNSPLTAAEQDQLAGFDEALECLYEQARALRQNVVGARHGIDDAVSAAYVQLHNAIDTLEQHRLRVYGARSGLTDED